MSRALLFAMVLCVPSAALADNKRRIEISNPALISSPEQRQNLEYLASCALDENTALTGNHAGETYDFPGAMGLAPGWADRALAQSERRWVSACILARTNAFGEHVLISMRSDNAEHDALTATREELDSHTLYEGGFFGDLFSETDAGAFVCHGPDHHRDMAAQEERKRVCTHDASDGSGLTRCGFVSIGPCPADGAPMVNGDSWPEVIHVWLDRANPG